jgi:predicted phosphodiesterase
MVRRLLIVLALLLSLGVASADPCRFVVMADNWCRPGVTDQVTPPPAYARALGEANLLQPEFIIFVGDMVRGYSDAATLEQQWDAFDAATKQVEMPVHLVVGNHDVFSKDSELIYQRRYGKLWYSFDVQDCHFVVLDSEDQTAPGKIAGAQLAWLKTDLTAAQGKRSFVFLHNPVWGQRPEDFAKSEWGRTIHPLLQAAGVDTVFAGHVHSYTLEPIRDGLRYVTGCGVSAEPTDGPLAGGFLHYLFVTAPGQSPARLAVIRPGAIDPEDVVTTEQAEQVKRFERQFRASPLVVADPSLTRTISWTVANPFATPVSGTARFAEAAGWKVSQVCGAFTLAPGQATTLSFTLTADPMQVKGPLSYTVDYTLQGRGAGQTEGSVGLAR